MLDLLADRTDANSSNIWVGETVEPSVEMETVMARLPLTKETSDAQTFQTIKVLLVETTAVDLPIVEQCLRYMSRFECLITQAGSVAAAKFALVSDTFDVIVTDGHALDVIVSAGTTPSLVVSDNPGSDATRKARMAGALHCLALNDLSPRLLETAISQALRGEQAMS
jgi:DNA-binding NarL/FixJ family response regulator